MEFGKRLIVSLVGLPFGLTFIFLSEGSFTIVLGVIFMIAGWEFAKLYRTGGLNPSGFIIIFGIAVLMLDRWLDLNVLEVWFLPAFVMMLMVYAIYRYHTGNEQAATDFVIHLGAIIYIGVLGGYFVAVRKLPEGAWWSLVAFFSVWLTDSGAYLIGSRFGKHLMAPSISPKKSWEGYFGGMAFTLVFIGLFWLLFRQFWLPADTALTFIRVELLALVIATFSTLGDFGVSIMKRQYSIKDSGNILPGHGGMLDRVDTWLWTGVLAYFVITIFFI